MHGRNKLRSSKPDEGKPPSTGTASPGVVASPGVLATENISMPQRKNSTRVKAPATCSIVTANFSTEMNDSVTLNPDGRAMLGCTNKRAHHKNKRLLKNKNVTKISTMNVRTLRAESKQLELTTNMRNQGIDILGLVDHKIKHEDKINVQQVDQHLIIISSAWRINANAAVEGVGIVRSKNAEDNLAEITKYNDRILVAHFNGNPRTTITIHYYARCEGSDESEEHYSNLATATTAIPKHNIVIVMGDFNAHLGKDDATYTFNNSTNSNGKLMIEYLQETNLMIGDTSFRKKKGKLWKYISDMNGLKSQVDYILINQNWKNSI